MPKLILRLPETELSVLRPAVMSVARPLFKLMGIPAATRIFFPTEGVDKAPQAGSTLGGQRELEEPNLLPFSNKIVIEVREEPNPDRLGSTAIHRAENFPIIRDDALSVMIKPIYADTEVTLNFKYRAGDKALAERVRDEIRARYSDLREVFEFSTVFNWQVPAPVMALMNVIHELRENVEGYGQDFDTYWKEITDARMSQLGNQGGKQLHWAVSEQQGSVLGYFDFQGIAEPGSKEDEGDTLTTSFSFKFRFEKPLAVAMHYPIIVHNQILPPDYRPRKEDDRTIHPARSMSLSTDALSQFRGGKTKNSFIARNGYDIPSFDEFIPGSVVPDTQRLFTALVKVNPADKKMLLDMTSLGNIKFTDLITGFMKKEAAWMNRIYNSVFCVSLYSDLDLLLDPVLVVDNDLVVRANNDRELRCQNRVRLSLVANWTFLTPRAIEAMRVNGAATIEIIKALWPWYDPLPVLLSNGAIRKDDMVKLIDHSSQYYNSPPGSPGGTNGQNNGQHIGFNTVGILFIESFKRN